ncbi:pyridine nucleotide-disulfide oxidoreductase domain-containing protein 1-like [Pomacea canaliculata]|uniref:pyridine nucleotide-disulfide oxidoreductase domain-containing protein 1-like n=1 Tax=Pomacea canaliculata TaxID=400727 RepID=UPI000D728DCD|nr:pyridine nucleotide-disulfide oxidoreductase domain-containing protein 1-like [Pomacea canaliculata]
MAHDVYHARFVVVGGGIAGVTCAETLASECPEEKVLLITASNLVKAIKNYEQTSRVLETFDVEEQPWSQLEFKSGIQVLQATVSSLAAQEKVVYTSCGKHVHYDKLCICSGGVPKMVPGNHPLVVGIRDTESVKDFQNKLDHAERVIIIGNGGIATELVYEIEGCEVIWAIKDKSIASTFVDEGAAQFFLPHLNSEKQQAHQIVKRQKFSIDRCSALGPDWAAGQCMKGVKQETSHHVFVKYEVEVSMVMSPEELAKAGLSCQTPDLFRKGNNKEEWPVYVQLTNNCVYGSDLVVSATGVTPNTLPFLPGNNFEVAEDGGLKVNENMMTSVPDVYAAGDVCSASWQLADLWFQMRLWTQARQMGCQAARCMAADIRGTTAPLDICFDLFAHVTKFFNFKVVLIGLFKAQGLGNDYELLLRVTKGEEYIKVVLHEGRLVGAILIGETDMEETFENLALNRTDLTPFKDHLLEPGIDIDDFFD